MTFSPTPEQLAILDAAKNSKASLMINAYAGCAKSTTLLMLTREIPTGGVILAFNSKIKLDMEKKIKEPWQAMTLNGLGHRAWGKSIGKRLTLEEKKLTTIITNLTKNAKISREKWDDIRRLVTCASNAGLVPKTYPHRGLIEDTDTSWRAVAEANWIVPDDEVIYFARRALVEKIKQAIEGVVDFDDQVYCSSMLGGVFPRFPLVMVDESQDLSPLNHIQLAKCAADRIIVVGDEKQALYAFRGADSASMQNLRKLRKDWVDLTLATTFRCPSKIVARNTSHAPGFTAYHTNTPGQVWNATTYSCRDAEEPFGTREEESLKISWTWSDVLALGFTNNIAIVSRNNAQLISMAFKLLRQGVGVKMQGRDIGKGLTVLSKKLCPNDDMPAEQVGKTISEWKTHQTDLALANGQEEKVAGIADRAESLLAVLESAIIANAGELRKALQALFARDSGTVTLTTIHRAKGLEWPLVIFLDPWRIPSKFAKKAAALGDYRQMEQEHNARYVAETRAQQALLLCNLQDFV